MKNEYNRTYSKSDDPANLHASMLHWRDDNPSKADGLNFCGHQFLRLFRNTGNDNDISRAITAYGQAAGCLSPDDPRLGGFLNDTGLGYLEQYESFGRFDDLQTAISMMTKGIAVTADDHPGLPPQLCNLGISLSHRFRRSRDLNDVSEAIQKFQRAAQLTPDGHDTLPIFLINLGNSFCDRFTYTGDLDDILEAIKSQQRAVQLVPDGHVVLPTWLQNLGNSYLRRFDCTVNIDDISEAIHHHRRAVEVTPDGDAGLPSRLNNLGGSFSSRFECTGDMQDISKALEYEQRAVHLAPNGQDLPSWLSNLGLSFSRRFKRTGEMGDIFEAIKHQQRAVQLTPDGHSDLPNNLHNLGISFLRRFERIGDMDDISEALKLQKRAVQLTPDGHPKLPNFLGSLGTSFSRRFERTGDMKDISEAIQHHQRAIQLTPDGHADLPAALNNLGLSFSRRFESTGDMSDISKAIEHLQHAIQLTPDDHPGLPVRFSNSGLSFSRRFERTGDINDISEAIQHYQRAVQLTPDGHADMPAWLNNLGTSLSTRFKRTGDLDDISVAINYLQRAVQLTPDGHAKMPAWLQNLGSSFLCRFERIGDMDDISEAIKHQKRAVRLTPDGHAELPARLNNLGCSFARHFERTGDLEDISEAIKHQQRSVQLISDGHLDLPGTLSNLGLSLSRRFKRTRDLGDISEAIKNQQHAVQLTPAGHANLATYLNNLGNAFLHRFEIGRDLDTLTRAVSFYRLSALSATGSPAARLQTAKKWAFLSPLLPSQPEELLDAHACIIQLLSVVSGLENTVQRRHETLTNSSQLPIDAAAAALSLDQPDKALEWLIEGRCIVWNQINQLRTPVDELHAHDQALADRFSAVARELENAGSRSKSETGLTMDYRISSEEQAQKHIKLAKEWDKLLVTIRNIPGFEDFLQPKRCADIMRNLPDEGAVVIINIHKNRCDALALIAGADEPLHIPLPKFSYHEAERLAKGLHRHLLRHGVMSRIGRPLGGPPLPDIDLAEVLSVLWSQVVWPILSFLAFSVCCRFLEYIKGVLTKYWLSQEPDMESCAKKPRIWWCPTGPLASLPIHASGIYVPTEGRPKQCLSDFAVSSYIPTVNGLLKTSELNSIDDVSTGMLVISQPNTPGQAQILGVVEEANRVARQLEKRRISSRMLVDRDGTVKDVLKAMESFSSIHLACHASQNTTSPLKSSIHLYDGPLELSEIMKKNLPISNFAFLSACETSTADRNLPEEVVHLAAGMLAAGYRSVVGTMWSIVDQHGGDIAEFFYESLLDDYGTSEWSRIDGTGAARALDRAVQRFREKVSDSPEFLLVWVPYIHLGV